MRNPGAPTPRDGAGRYAAHDVCEACRKPIRGEYISDDQTCNAHGVGLLLCARVRCIKLREAMPVAERVAFYGRPS